jgi:selenoprotein W-related protein
MFVLVPLSLAFAASTTTTRTTLPSAACCRNMVVSRSRPLLAVPPRFLSMEYCTGCRWDFRAFWLVQELLDREANFHLWMIPSNTAGTFAVKSITGLDVFVKAKGGPFPDPASDLPQWLDDSKTSSESVVNHQLDNVDGSSTRTVLLQQALSTLGNDKLPCVDIVYTRDHRQRALYLAQECLRTFSDEVKSLSLRPYHVNNDNGTVDDDDSRTMDDVQVSVIVDSGNDDAPHRSLLVWERGLPETKVLKQKIRDVLVPNKALGHSDSNNDRMETSADENALDDETAAEQRRFFGVA